VTEMAYRSDSFCKRSSYQKRSDEKIQE